MSGKIEKTAASPTADKDAPLAPANADAEARQRDIVQVADVDGRKGGHGAGDFFRGDVERHLSVFDKKASLINAELDKFGLGRYQWCIWFLTGFGYFLDLSWSQGVGILAPAILQEMNVPSNRAGELPTFANAGLAIGALGFGLGVDVIGRKWAFNITCLITSIFGLLVAAPRYNYEAVCGIYFLASIGLGGNIPIDALIALEFLPQNRRNLVSLLSLWQPVGVVFASVVAYGFAAPRYRCEALLPSCRAQLEVLANGETEPCCGVSDNMGWRYTIIVLGCVTLLIFFLRFVVFKFHESPKYLLSRGREQEAIDVLHRIAKFNKAPPPTLTMQDFADIDQAETGSSAEPALKRQNNGFVVKRVVVGAWRSFAHLKMLFTNKLQLFIFVLFAITYIGDYWSFNLAGYFLPIILLQTNTSDGRNSVQETYKQYIWIYLPGIIGAVLALLSVNLPLIGRKWSLVFSATLQGLAMAMYTQVDSTAAYVGLNAFAYIMQTYFNAVLYHSAPELFDTAIRGSASGMLSCLGRLSGIVAPIAAQNYLDPETGSPTVLWLGAGGIWLAAITMVFLPVEMRKRQMY